MILGISGPQDHANAVRIELSSKLPQEFRQIVGYCPRNESQTFESFTSTTFVKNRTSIWVLRETAWGEMSIMTVGSFQIFIKLLTSTRVLHVKVMILLKTMIFISSA